MTEFIVERCGASNTFNSLGIVGTVEAHGKGEALRQALLEYKVYVGQYLTVRYFSKASKSDKELAELIDAENEQAEQHWQEESYYFSALADERNATQSRTSPGNTPGESPTE